MGRRVPSENNITLIDPFLYFSFYMVALATSITIISALCSVRFRKKSSAPAPMSDHDSHEEPNALNESTNLPPIIVESTTTSLEQEHPNIVEATTLENTTHKQNHDTLVKELPLPPALQQHPSVDPKIMKRATSEHRLSFNISNKMPRSFSMARNWEQRGFNDGRKKGKLNRDESIWMKTKGKLKTDDSVWMKTIILGGKCVPDEDDDVVIYEGKGKRISAYHPRKSTSVSLSRQCSYINTGAFSHPERINNIYEERKMKL
ncbi:hypothetical protein VNO78_29016 [Psophocarpus tetragonolobus]|uniref:Transmembrane protein n=1 Tax=Psophocarpus tetragonolobus TaxID=3891 RepID=A0AAN9X083_PSOTE